MRTRDAVRYAKKIARQDIETIAASRSELMVSAKHLSSVRDAIKDLPFSDPGSFRMRSWAPRPAALLLDVAFREMLHSQRTKPATSKLKFASGTLIPLAGIRAQDATHEGRWSPGDAAACGMAESHFLSALEQVRKLRNRGQNQVSTYLDETGTPILFRKSNYESTAINLTAIALGDAVLPAGTILAVGANQGGQKTGEYKGGHFNLATYALPQIVDIAPVRLSPWAYDNPEDRAIYGLPQGRVDALREDCHRSGGDYLENTTLGDYIEASQKIAELCTEPNV